MKKEIRSLFVIDTFYQESYGEDEMVGKRLKHKRYYITDGSARINMFLTENWLETSQSKLGNFF